MSYRLERNKWNCPYPQTTWWTYKEDLKTKTKLLELINESGKVRVNKVHKNQSTVLQYTRNLKLKSTKTSLR